MKRNMSEEEENAGIGREENSIFSRTDPGNANRNARMTWTRNITDNVRSSWNAYRSILPISSTRL